MSAVNLMSIGSRRRESIRMRLRQWCWGIWVVAGLLALATLERYVAYCNTWQRQFTLEIRYDPIAELKAANQVLARQIAAIRREKQFVLALSEREPTITVLGVLGNAVADTQQRVFLQKIDLVNHGLGQTIADNEAELDVAGVASNGSAVNEFAESLRNTVAFGSVEITSQKEYRLKQQSMHDFSLRLSF